MKLVLLRHGESEANFQNYWTGWLDVALTEKGMQQATEAGRKMNEQGLVFDIVYTSVLKRAIKTSQLALEEMNQLYLPVQKTWRLNERHYGALVGKNKTEMKKEYGEEQVKKWRRGYREVPPLVSENHFDRRYDSLDPRLLSHGESLEMTVERVVPLWQDELAPHLLGGKNVLVVGHGNSLRALTKYLEDVPENQLDTIDIPNAQPIQYTLNKELEILGKEFL
ncbi:2,3-bisphosphoglycerate-dependent phosphoglycerate mutase [Enterococcus hirae]|uniref:2,3-bisphosphoglycerate-dependent phosphoglycerate mutase n=1 Tax=Enterococcus hirae TaxID=1354 RepID=UPI001094C4D5|nr:2,3-diphosphoglycerate-dependent phosphoglycerate mutase [Enterococcus hirae]EMF0041143.1 2,3-diphosphoglycerate-dependent phosphoglycerate mutase [Enterococcus hirae]EMF0114272.1 2,3-diphosphoglycerate-dependent phosphoglycerate mutase [Enterococcus hirae]MBO1092179.1 2,3-diphosphoglycerate-dependent phosphoglycerate mutase [Enterococcus hirae]MCR1911991.1 2,3-diphosphoglycerate-dependent phosphoglycerate mutase [Enterococcus hirae]MDL4887719.1 2,3-diphosphoglycerate-dependent phosphoglyce